MAQPKMKIMLPLCLEWPDKEVYMPRPDGGAVEIDWQLLSPVTMPVILLYPLMTGSDEDFIFYFYF